MGNILSVSFMSILLDILGIIVVIALGSIVVVVVSELILHLLGGEKKDSDKKDDDGYKRVVKDDDIVVYSQQDMPSDNNVKPSNVETIDGDKIEEIDYDKAIEEQKMLQGKQGVVKTQSAPEVQKPVEKAPVNEDIFWDDDEEDEFNKILDEVVAEAKKAGEQKTKKEEIEEVPAVKVVDDSAKKEEDEAKKAEEEARRAELEAETKKELEELKALKEQQQKEIEEFKQMKEDFAREKEEQLAMMKDNLNKAKEEEIEKIRQEAIKEQEKLEKMQDELEEEKARLEEEKAKLKEEVVEEQVIETVEEQPIIKETIIKDEEELNKMKYKNLMRMNNRLTRIIRDTERLQSQKQRQEEKLEEERQKLLAKQEQEKLKEQERQIELERQEHERQKKILEAEQRKVEIERKLQEASKKAGKYKLDSKVVKVIPKDRPIEEQVTEVIEEQVVTTIEPIPHTDTVITTVDKVPMKSTVKPMFAKEYYQDKLQELEEELKDAEKELRINKAEYIPLTRIHKAYARDSEKLRKKEMQVAKQKVALYGVNSRNVDPAKKEKLDENLKALAELKDSVQHCEEVIKKNKDRYPIIEKNNKLITKQINRINEDIKVCEKALEYYKKNN